MEAALEAPWLETVFGVSIVLEVEKK